MSENDSWHLTLEEITRSFVDLADRVSNERERWLDPYVDEAIRDLVYHLELHIPGLDTPPDPEAATALANASRAALERGDEQEALSRALRGLAFSPHDPALFYLLSASCFEFGSVETAMRLLYHTLWIHPGHREARADLEALSAFLEDEEGRSAA